MAPKGFVPSIFLERFCVLEKGFDMSYYTIDVVSVKLQRPRSRRSPKTTMAISWFGLKEQVEMACSQGSQYGSSFGSVGFIMGSIVKRHSLHESSSVVAPVNIRRVVDKR